jgi:hypothetical protein
VGYVMEIVFFVFADSIVGFTVSVSGFAMGGVCGV